MPDLEDLLSDKNERLESVPSKFVSSINGIQNTVSKEIEIVVSQLEMENGNILLTERNMALINSLTKRINDLIFDEVYEKNLTSFIGEFKTQAGLSDQYFSIIGEFEKKTLYDQILRQTQINAIGLLNEDAFTQALILPIKHTLESSITNNVSFTDTMTNLRYIILGDDEVDGRLMSHVKRVAYDSFAVSDRSYTNTIATDLGLEFYRYTGGKVEETRCFCLERKGKYFHRKEIEGWGEGKGVGECGFPWQGMNSNTDKATIFYYAGGYNCKHSILPVSIKSVPREVIERSISKGYYQEA
jgi:hypothetical protein